MEFHAIPDEFSGDLAAVTTGSANNSCDEAIGLDLNLVKPERLSPKSKCEPGFEKN